jgi:hypothetical protein
MKESHREGVANDSDPESCVPPLDPGGARSLETAASRGTQKGTPFVNAPEVGPLRSTGEGSEQKAKAYGGAGGKVVDQGERNGGTHGPGANRVKGTQGVREAAQRDKGLI